MSSLGVGAGPVNGDQAVYLQQASERGGVHHWTHVGYVWVLRALPELSSTTADLLSCVCVGGSLMFFSSYLRAQSGVLWGSLALFAMLLPWAPFGEVDTVWFLLAMLALVSTEGWGALFAGLMVAVSPTAIAGLPVLWWWRRDRRWTGGVVAVFILIVLSSGAWLWGTRGVLTGGWSPMPGRQLQSVVLPLLSLLMVSPRGAFTAVLVGGIGLFAPGDVPGHWWVGLAIALLIGTEIAGTPRWKKVVLGGLLVLYTMQSVRHVRRTFRRVRAETETLRQIAQIIEPGDALVGSWSAAMRVQVQTSVDLPRRTVNQVTPEFCEQKIESLFLLPGVQWNDAHPSGPVRAIPGDDPVVKKGCERR